MLLLLTVVAAGGAPAQLQQTFSTQLLLQQRVHWATTVLSHFQQPNSRKQLQAVDTAGSDRARGLQQQGS
jgi:hypothetical protein